MTQSLGPWHNIDINGVATDIRRANWTVYQDATFQTWSAQGYATGTSPSYNYNLVNPVSIAISDAAGKVLEQISAVRSSTTGKLQRSDIFPQSSYVRWTTTQYTDCCFAASRRVYHSIPASGTGSPGANYDQSDYGYDVMKRQNRTVTPGGTITYRVFDSRGNAITLYMGTNDNGATDDDPTGGGALGNNMVLVAEWEYDAGEDGLDGTMTEMTQHVDAVTVRVTSYLYDWRDRQIAIDGEIDFYQQRFYDNLDRLIRVDRRDTSAEGNLVGRNVTLYDDRNRVFRTIGYGVDPGTGVVGNSLSDNNWYDASGNIIKSKPYGSQLFTKTFFDSLGRATNRYNGYDLDEISYSEASDLDDDVILEQSETIYDNASNSTKSTLRQRYHNTPDTQTGPLQDPSNNPKARVSYSATWPDAIGRSQADANYGTNGGTPLSRPTTIPARSDTTLVDSTDYDSAGNTFQSIDASGMVTRFEYDDAGRQVAQILNFQPAGSSSSSSSNSGGGCEPSADHNVTVLTSFNSDGNISMLTALNSSTGNQVTEYIYGTTLADSGIATSILKRKEIYPDSVHEDDVIKFGYNRQSEAVIVTDQGGTVHEFDYDLLGRQTQDRVTALGTDVDGTIIRIQTTYEVRGMKEHLTSYDNATVGMGSIVNDCQFAYNDFSQVVTEYQSHDGAVNTDTTPNVRYTYADGSANTIRKEQLIYPDGRELTYDYGVTDGIDDASSRVASLVDDDGTTHLTDYSYLGMDTFVVTDYSEPETKYTLVGTAGGNDPDTGDIYRGLDRFGRVKDSYWYNYGDSSDTDRIKYGYDRVGNRLWRENVVATQAGKALDELYQYDQIHRLKHMDRGTLDGPHSGISTTTFAQCWTLDETGNWGGFREDDDGDGTWDLIQGRTANLVNEISNISEFAGPVWAVPTYSATGNMTSIPKPVDLPVTFTAVYDAWNRLVKLANAFTSDSLVEYQYDGAKRRIIQTSYLLDDLDEMRHIYYTEPSQWQVLEECVGASQSSAITDRNFVWGLRSSNDLILRYRYTAGFGSLDEKCYALEDANENVTSILDPTGNVIERFGYAPYGSPLCLSADWVQVEDAFNWETLFAGYRYDTQSGLFNVRHRGYHPLIGTWIQRDPLRHTISTPFSHSALQGLYEYCQSAPISQTDPSGLLSCQPGNAFALTESIQLLVDGEAAEGSRCSLTRISIRQTELKFIRQVGLCQGASPLYQIPVSPTVIECVAETSCTDGCVCCEWDTIVTRRLFVPKIIIPLPSTNSYCWYLYSFSAEEVWVRYDFGTCRKPGDCCVRPEIASEPSDDPF